MMISVPLRGTDPTARRKNAGMTGFMFQGVVSSLFLMDSRTKIAGMTGLIKKGVILGIFCRRSRDGHGSKALFTPTCSA